MSAAMVNHDVQKVLHDLAGAEARGDFFGDAAFFRLADGRAGKKIAQLGRGRVSRTEIAQLLEHRSSRTLCESNVRERIGVLQASGLQLGLPCRLSTKLATSASCVCAVSCLATR